MNFFEFKQISLLANIYFNTQLHDADQRSYSAFFLTLMKRFLVVSKQLLKKRTHSEAIQISKTKPLAEACNVLKLINTSAKSYSKYLTSRKNSVRKTEKEILII